MAVVGMSIRAAEVSDTADLWRLISTGRSGRHEFSAQESARRGVPEHRYKNPAYVPVAYPIADSLAFDVRAFGSTGSEAELTDPQHRVILQACYRAVESAGCFIGSLPDRVGVFLGSRASDYGAQIAFHGDGRVDSAKLAIGTEPDYMSSRVSYAFGLTGPSMTVLTACSSSSVAVHLACQAILAGECDSALAGGVAVDVRDAGYLVTDGGIHSPRGRCEPYTTSADGTVDGNGVAVLFLRRLDAALAEGNPILGVIAGTAVNNDGRARAGFTVPGVTGQIELIGEALDVAELSASRIGLLEGHGAGTGIGDLLEIDAASQAFRSAGADVHDCRLHSVKANIGNLTAAAGAAGVISCLLAMRHGSIPPNAPLTQGASPVDLRGTPFSLSAEPVGWRRSDEGRYAAVSSFGMGGTNAHIIIGDAGPEVRAAARKGRSWQLLPLSADDPHRLATAVRSVRSTVDESSAEIRQDIGHTLRTGRPELSTRATALVPVHGGPADVRWPDPARFRVAPETPPPLVVLLPGELPRDAPAFALYQAEPVFRTAVDDGLAVLERRLPPDTFAAVRGAFRPGTPSIPARISQPVLHLLAVGQHSLLGSLGIRPDLLIGYGTGELTAAHLSGALSFEDAALGDTRPGERARFDEALRTAAAGHPEAVYLQLSGGSHLLDAGLVVAPGGENGESTFPRMVADLWERGVRIDWDAYAERDHALRADVAPREFDRTPHLHPVLLDHCPGVDPAELTGKRAG
nr:hypothetical protein Ade03nite_85090 [Actinoplanes derwentensis]